MRDAPIGTIVAYGGNVFGQEEEATTGWLLCDGRILDRNDTANAALFRAIGFSWGGDGSNNFNLPDLRGYFLRGVDVRGPADRKDPDGATRTANHAGGAVGNAVGTVQDDATAAPKPPSMFETAVVGDHSHAMNFEQAAKRDVDHQSNTVAFPSLVPSEMPVTEPSGSHSHAINGGNRETRPINAAVNWIIRAE